VNLLELLICSDFLPYFGSVFLSLSLFFHSESRFYKQDEVHLLFIIEAYIVLC
jgi:hypothetical protein